MAISIVYRQNCTRRTKIAKMRLLWSHGLHHLNGRAGSLPLASEGITDRFTTQAYKTIFQGKLSVRTSMP